MRSLNGASILIVEDEYLIAEEVARYFASLGATVLGPVPTVEQARRYTEQADAAVLDINLAGQAVFPIADRLAERGVPFVFFSGYDRSIVPGRLRHVASLAKPANFGAIFDALFPNPRTPRPADTDDVLAMLPKLRLAARILLPESRAADRLVELTLEQAIKEVRSRPDGVATETWLSSLLLRLAKGGPGMLH